MTRPPFVPSGRFGQIWTVYRVRGPLMGGIGGVSLAKLGAVRAVHQPAAMLRAFAKFPKEPEDKITVRIAGQTRKVLTLARGEV